MELYLVRHASAEPYDPARHGDDSARGLTEEGIGSFKEACRGFLSIEAAPEVIISSPYKRALQTAEILASSAGGTPRVAAVDSLGPGTSVKALADDIRQHCGGAERVAAIGHEPDISRVMSAILFGSIGGEIAFKKGAICRLDVGRIVHPLRGQLRWFLTTEQLRRLS